MLKHAGTVADDEEEDDDDGGGGGGGGGGRQRKRKAANRDLTANVRVVLCACARLVLHVVACVHLLVLFFFCELADH